MRSPSFNFFFLKPIALSLFLFLFLFSAQSQLSNSLTFDGVDDQVTISNPGIFDFTSGTVEAWVKPGSFNANKVFISMRTSSGNRWSAHLNQSAGTIGIEVGATFNTLAYTFQAGTWYHIALVMTTANTAVYVNGLFIGNTGNGINAAVTGNPLIIGSPDDMTFPGEWFTGDIDEVRVWSTSLTQAQIKETIFKAPAANASGLLAYYAFNDGSGSALVNSCTNTSGVDGTLVNGPLWANSPVKFAGNALSFDGTNDYVQIPWSASHDMSNTLTVEAWVYPTNNNWHNILMKGNYGYGFSLSGFGGTGGCGNFGKLVFWDQAACGSTIRSSITYALNTWQHVAVTVEDIGTQLRIYFYLNGVQDGPYLSGASAISNGGANKLLYLGMQGECFCNYFSGNMDELRLWSEVRTQGQIQTAMNNELDPAIQPNLVAYYTFNQGIAAGTNTGLPTVIDQKGSNNATLTNFGLSAVSSNYVAQKSGLFILPLAWLSFTAQKQDDKVLLNWGTASEENTKDFIIQHSPDGTAWSNVGRIAASGNSNTSSYYTYTHTNPVSGINYYRIQQTDLDDKRSYSEIRSVKFLNDHIPFSILVNPVTNGSMQVQVNVVAVLSLYNSDGRLVWSRKATPGIQTFDISAYAKGVYLLKSDNHLQKIVVQ
ncbi:MAG: hypothetical protein JWM28_26 [Chitinophagaceae bacterium]|nr:hypothetical protein [Chitinophagaceae bacterium]